MMLTLKGNHHIISIIMKNKLFRSILLILAIGLLATSCEKNDPANNSILGSWKITAVQCEEALYGQFSVGAVWTFGENGDLTFVVNGESATLNYTRNGKKVTIGEVLPLTISSLTSSTLVLSYTEANIETLKVTFSKITHI